MINETSFRLGCFVAILCVMILWESVKPNRSSPVGLKQRWTANFLLMVLGALVGRLIVPAGLAAIVVFAQHESIGLWNRLPLSLWLTVPISVLLLDCLIYWQHRIFHRVPILWRMHRVHHADPHLDASTGLRFHPLEIALSLCIKAGAVLLLGAPLLAVLIFEVLLNGTSIFNHSNIKLPVRVDKFLRMLVVTQAMHRIHHSQIVSETDSNFGFNLSIWDRLFNSYTDNATQGDEGIQLGLKEYSSVETNTNLKALLLMPFRGKPD